MGSDFLRVKNLHVTFETKSDMVHAVRGLDLTLQEGSSLGIVGESGSGKTAAVHAIAGLSSGNLKGQVSFLGKELHGPQKEIGVIFQDPMTALNPTMKVGKQIAEGPIYHKLASKKEAWKEAIKLLELVGVPNPELRVHQYPHELSGGMRQRALIATALAVKPKLLIADEPTTALDVIVQAQILALLQDLKKHFQMSLILISHNFSVVSSICDQLLVMYAGKVVETGPTEKILKNPEHPYTQLLLKSIPSFDLPKKDPLHTIQGSPPDLRKPSSGCAFKERCPFRALKCEEEPIGAVACWRRL